ncbi:hypothetical protein [Streptomyces sp. NPDC091209]|uniref:hypothetical protein n=1 Tax=Streptomyces sp. NPDC091209 TaxID=3365974 RepID=UPI003800C65D
MTGNTGDSTCAGQSRTEVVASGEGAVFVDESGRRRSWLRSMGWIVAVSCVCFATALAAVVSGGDSAAPWLPLPNGTEKAHKDTSAAGAASRVEARPTDTTSPSAAGRDGASPSPRGSSAGFMPLPTADPVTDRRAGAAGSGQQPSHRGASATPSPSAVAPSVRPSATPPRVAPAVPPAEASGSPSPSPSGTPGEATPSPTPDPSGATTAGTTSAEGLLVRVRLTGLAAFG